MQHDFILLDRSGSMGTRWAEALGSVNAYVEELVKTKVDTGVTVMMFDTGSFEVIRDRITPATFRPVSDKDAMPRGGTPLNDAIGKIVGMANAGFNGVQYDRLALIIITDGEENSSHEVTHEAAKTMLDECRKKGWQVIFIGADFDNQVQSRGLGNAATHSHMVSGVNMSAAMRGLAGTRGAYGEKGAEGPDGVDMSFTDEQKAKYASSTPAT